MKALADAEARHRILTSLDATLIVEAAAGTGKTTALIQRMVAILKAGRGKLPNMVALTFTDRAAGEMKLRLRTALETERDENRDEPIVRDRLDAALRALEEAHIETIHAFCGDLLHQRPVEAGVDPRFEVQADGATSALLDEVFDRLLEGYLQAPPPGIRRALRRSADGNSPVAALRAAARRLVEHRDFPAPYSRPPLDRQACIDGQLEALGQLAALASRSASRTDPLRKGLAALGAFVEQHQRFEEARGVRDYDELEYALRTISRKPVWGPWRKGRGKWFAPELLREEVVRLREETKASLEAALAKLEADLAAQLREDLRPIVAQYEAEKVQHGYVDFLDLLIKARDLLRDHPSVLREVQGRYSHVFVDEFQDTDPLQADIIRLLCLDPERPTPTSGFSTLVAGKLFLVGDPKQSIYRFRRADISLYERTKGALQAQGAELLQLSTSFRSVPALQSLVNVGFGLHMTGADDGSQATYLPLAPFRDDRRGQPAVIALPVPRPYGPYGGLTKQAIEASLPDAVAAFLDFLVRKSGFVVSEQGEDVPLHPRHICLLFRRLRTQYSEITRDYVRALEARGIAHVLLGGRDLLAREEVVAITTALSAIEWPGDDLHVYATLRGPLFSLSDGALFDYATHVAPLHPLRRPRAPIDGERAEVAAALGVLADLHVARNRRPCAETVHALLDATRAHAAFAVWPNGEQALANVLSIADQALAFERGGSTSFRAFVQWLTDAQEGNDGRDVALRQAAVIEDGTEGVRMMTVHSAKGLEFPVVILCEPTASRTPRYPSRFVDNERGLCAMTLCNCAPADLNAHEQEVLRHDAAEEVRIAYVAATRAQDILVVPVVGDEPKEGWVDVLHGGLYPATASRREADPAPGCPRVGNDSVLETPVRAQRRPEDSVQPGLHRPQQGDHRVVFWDPATLTLDVDGGGGIRQQQLLMEDDDGRHTQAGVAQHERWRARRAQALKAGRVKETVVSTVTARSQEDALSAESGSGAVVRPIHIEIVPGRRAQRPSGKRFGSLVHAVLADAAFREEHAWLSALAQLHGRLLGADGTEQEHAVFAALDALQHPRLRAAANSPDARFEAPICLLAPDAVLDGVVDLVYRLAAERWVVIDFKTDKDPDKPAYRTQVGLYADAIERATGMPCDGVLLGI